MSTLYSIDLKVGLMYNGENIRYIFVKGLKAGLVYLGDSSHHFLSVDEATKKILYTDPDSGDRYVTAKFQDTFFLVCFFQSDDNMLIFSIGSFSHRWCKNFCGGGNVYMIDFAQYLRLAFCIVNDLTVTSVSCESDNNEFIKDKDYCATAYIDMGQFGTSYDGEGIKGSFIRIINNGISSKFVFFDEKMVDQDFESFAQQSYEFIRSGFPVYLYATKNDIPFKIEIQRDNQVGDFVSVYPLKPYRMKEGYGSDSEKIDVAFYMQRLIELCENFALYELRTFF